MTCFVHREKSRSRSSRGLTQVVNCGESWLVKEYDIIGAMEYFKPPLMLEGFFFFFNIRNKAKVSCFSLREKTWGKGDWNW